MTVRNIQISAYLSTYIGSKYNVHSSLLHNKLFFHLLVCLLFLEVLFVIYCFLYVVFDSIKALIMQCHRSRDERS